MATFKNKFSYVTNVANFNKPIKDGGAYIGDGQYLIAEGSSIPLLIDIKSDRFSRLLEYARNQYEDDHITPAQARENITLEMHRIYAGADESQRGLVSSYDPAVAANLQDSAAYWSRGGIAHIVGGDGYSVKGVKKLENFANNTLVCAEHAKILGVVDAALMKERGDQKQLMPNLMGPVYYVAGMAEFNPATQQPGHHAFLMTRHHVIEATAFTKGNVVNHVMSDYIRGYPGVLHDVTDLENFNPARQHIVPVTKDGKVFSFYTLPADEYKHERYEDFKQYVNHMHDRLGSVLVARSEEIINTYQFPEYVGPTPRQKPIGPTITVQDGDSAYSVAGLFKAAGIPITLEELKQANKLDDKYTIYGGQILKHPFYNERASRHVVHGGETVWRISNRFGVSQEALRTANHIGDDNVIRVGQTLDIATARDITALQTTLKKSPTLGKMWDNPDLLGFLRGDVKSAEEELYDAVGEGTNATRTIDTKLQKILKDSGVLGDNATSGHLQKVDEAKDLNTLGIVLDKRIEALTGGKKEQAKLDR